MERFAGKILRLLVVPLLFLAGYLSPNPVSAQETVLYRFKGRHDGGAPEGSLLRDKNGYLYGTTDVGGTYDQGVVYKLAADGKETVLHSFEGGDDEYPTDGVIADRKGNLYGTTAGAEGHGTVFKLAPDGEETVLHAFCSGLDCSDGDHPYASEAAPQTDEHW